MFARLTIGQYLPGTSLMHRLEARTKLIMAFVYIVALLLGRGWSTILLCSAFTLLGFLLARLPVRSVLRGLGPILWLVLITLALNIFLTPGRVVWSLGPLHATEQGLTTGLRAGIRLGLLVIQTTVLTLTTRPLDLTDGIERLGSPLQRIGVPIHELALMSSIALRFVPVLSEEADRILMAQRARGGGLRRGRGILVSAIGLLVPLLLAVFRRAEELALAMEARGYHGAEGRTHYRTSRMGTWDVVASLTLAALLCFSIRTRW